MFGRSTSVDSKEILVVTQFFPPESLGGAHRWQKLAENLPKGTNCNILCPPPAFPFGEFKRTNRLYSSDEFGDIPVTRLWTYQPNSPDSAIGRILNYSIFALFASVYVLFNFWRYDFIVTVSAPHTTFLPGLFGKLLGLIWIVDIFDLWLDNAANLGYIGEESLLYDAVHFLEEISIKHSDHLTVITPTMGTFFQEKYGIDQEKITDISFGVDGDLFKDRGESANRRIIYTGNIGEAQAFKPFIQGFAAIDDESELWFVGTGERRSELETFVDRLGIQRRVRFLGTVPRTEIPSLLSESMLAIVPLKTDHTLDYARPTKLIEAMAMATPYVASAVDEIQIVTQQSNAGLAVENDPKIITLAIRQLLNDREERKNRGKCGVAFVDANHRWERLSERLGMLLEDL